MALKLDTTDMFKGLYLAAEAETGYLRDRNVFGEPTSILLEQLFSPNSPADHFRHTTSHIDAAASILVGIAANESMPTGRKVIIDNLFVLPQKTRQQESETIV